MLKKIRPIIYSSVLALCISPAVATEVDSFTDRYLPMNDATERLNFLTNELIQQSISAANNNSNGNCNEQQMYRIMHNTLVGMGSGTWALLEQMVEDDPLIEKRTIAVNQSVYRNVSGFYSPSFALHNPLGSVINLGGYIIGTDKVGHFVDQGYEYFLIAYIRGHGEDAALSYGEFTEKTFYGLMATGIYAYADLMANYLGMQFWSTLTGNYKETARPLLSCTDQGWVQDYQFDWGDYVDAALDEGINCTGQSDLIWNKVKLNLDQMEKLDEEHRYQCPVTPEICPQLFKKYGIYADRLISPKCR